MQKQRTASTAKRYNVSRKNIPLSCPMPNMRLWDAHPKVYLPIEETGKATCPYCDTKYLLSDEQSK